MEYQTKSTHPFIVHTTSLNKVVHSAIWGLPGQELGLCKHVHFDPKQGKEIIKYVLVLMYVDLFGSIRETSLQQHGQIKKRNSHAIVVYILDNRITT